MASFALMRLQRLSELSLRKRSATKLQTHARRMLAAAAARQLRLSISPQTSPTTSPKLESVEVGCVGGWVFYKHLGLLLPRAELRDLVLRRSLANGHDVLLLE